MFSCCCGRLGRTWRPVCDCFTGFNATSNLSQCSATCLRDSVNPADSYYNAARKIYNHVRMLYPKAQIWFTGHSLGGGILTTTHTNTSFLASCHLVVFFVIFFLFYYFHYCLPCSVGVFDGHHSGCTCYWIRSTRRQIVRGTTWF
jgi:hypothetical protein